MSLEDLFALNSAEMFDDETPEKLRQQILKYFVSSVMSDSERAKWLGLHPTCRMREGAKIICPEQFKCGENVFIGENAIIDASGGLEIGAHTSIGLSVFVWSHSSHEINKKFENYKSNPNIIRKKTKIGKGCFIAGPSVIFPGVTVGDRVVIGPMSIVEKDLEDGVIFTANKAVRDLERKIKKLEKKVEELMSRQEHHGKVF